MNIMIGREGCRPLNNQRLRKQKKCVKMPKCFYDNNITILILLIDHSHSLFVVGVCLTEQLV